MAIPPAVGASSDSSTDAPGVVSVDITRENFARMIPMIQRALNQCEFYSFDCEMTGLILDTQREEFFDDMQERYTKTAINAQTFNITQFGLSVFKQAAQPSTAAPAPAAGASANGSTPPPTAPAPPASSVHYEASTFNFYIFPEPVNERETPSRKFMCDSGSLSFLASQGFDFNKFVYQGVPYIPAKALEKQQQSLARDNGERHRRSDIAVTKPEDQAYVAALVADVTRWLAAPEAEAEATLLLPKSNSFQRLLCHQELAKAQFGVASYPGFAVTKGKRAGVRSARDSELRWVLFSELPCVEPPLEASALGVCWLLKSLDLKPADAGGGEGAGNMGSGIITDSALLPCTAVCFRRPAPSGPPPLARLRPSQEEIYNWTHLRLVRSSMEGVALIALAERKAKVEAVEASAGFTRVFQMMQACGAPAVGHNCMCVEFPRRQSSLVTVRTRMLPGTGFAQAEFEYSAAPYVVETLSRAQPELKVLTYAEYSESKQADTSQRAHKRSRDAVETEAIVAAAAERTPAVDKEKPAASSCTIM
ncbi:MAG: hypothetical protein WDW38_008127 [Sanguina aurantia]